MRKNDYWRNMGNPQWGWKMLSQDIKNGFKWRKQDERPSDNNIPTNPNTPESIRDTQYQTQTPTYVTNYYNNPSSQYRYLGFFQTILLILFLVFVTVVTYYI